MGIPNINLNIAPIRYKYPLEQQRDQKGNFPENLWTAPFGSHIMLTLNYEPQALF